MTANRYALPAIIGHRGLAALAPENTLASLRAAWVHGLGMVEFDVRLSRDGVAMLFHDDELTRTSNGRGQFWEFPYQELSALDAGAWFSPEFAGVAIPSLAEALAFCRDHGLAVNLELKPNPGEERATVEAVATLLETGVFPGMQLLLSSFNTAALAAARSRLPAVARGYLSESPDEDWLAGARRQDCVSVHIDEAHAEPDRIAALKAEGLAVAAYTVNRRARAEQLWALGVDAVFSDWPLQDSALAPE